MTDPNLMQQDDPWAIADNAKPREFEYYGQVHADVWFGFFPGGGQRPIPFDPNVHPQDKRSVMIEIQIIPIADQNVTFDIKQSYTNWSADWTKVTLPSIKALGLDGLRSLNNRFVRVIQAPGKSEKKDDAGNKTGEFYKTFKFLEVYPDQAACEAAYSGSAPVDTEDPQPADASDKEKETALKFARVVVENSAKGQTDPQIVIDTVTANIATMPMINKHFTGQSPEIQNMIMEVMSNA